MGSVFSSNSTRYCNSNQFEGSSNEICKRQRITTCCERSTRLIPFLPDEISLQILARVPRIYYSGLKLVSRSWREALCTSEIYNLRKELKTREEWLFILTRVEESLSWCALDPVSQKWLKLPPIPHDTIQDTSRKGLAILQKLYLLGSSVKIADVIRGWLGRGDALDKVPFCGCSVGAVNGCLYVLGGLSRGSALRSVWRYDPILNTWSEVSPMLTARAYSKTGVIANKLYVVGGVTRHQGGLSPLQSAEVFDAETGEWSEVPNMPFSKAQVMPTAFLADILKPIATGLTTYRGKLYVPQSLYCWPFFVDAGGEIYDPQTNSWVEMPVGMGEGWPAKQAGTKLCAVIDDELYALDLSGSLDSAKIKVYDHRDDSWKVVSGEVPVTHDHTDTESPYLLISFLGKLHVIIRDTNGDIAVLQATTEKPIESNNSSTLLNGSSSSESSDGSSSMSESAWKVIASRKAGSIELVSCQSLRL